MAKKRIAIIGAGASGLPCIRHALLYGADVTCFEGSNDIGGLWRYKQNETDESSVMKTTVINTSKELTAYSDYIPNENLANYMHNRDLLEYFRSYAQHYDLLRHIKFNHNVLNVERAKDYASTGDWKVIYQTSEGITKEEIFNGVLLANGHHTYPHWPTPFPGQDKFPGTIIHSHSYKDFHGFEEKTVVVLGIGNSGVDVAVELSRVAKQVYLSTRKGTWLMTRLQHGGRGFDMRMNTRWWSLRKLLPEGLMNTLTEMELNARCDHEKYGLNPKHRVFSAHPTLNDELPVRLSNGTVRLKPNIARFEGSDIVFDDGTVVQNVDVVVSCTGYLFDLKIVENGKLIQVENNEVDSLYKFMFPVETSDHNTLCMIGLIQPFGSIMPVSELQSRLFLENLYNSNNKLPNKAQMNEQAKNYHVALSKKFVKSTRHTIQVDYVSYMDDIAKLAGCQAPSLLTTIFTDPVLAYHLFFGPITSYVYRLQGPFAWEGARDAVVTTEQRYRKATTSLPEPSIFNSFNAIFFVAFIVLLLTFSTFF